jgi:hypothetical protein
MISREIVLVINLDYKNMWIPITIDEYVKLHLKKHKNENEKVIRVRIEAALDDYQKGVKCKCGNDIWIVGSASTPEGCYTCLSGKRHPAGEFEIDTALEKKDKYGRRHIDEMDPRTINGMFDDDGYEINRNSIKKPSLCLTCTKHHSEDWEDEILCDGLRYDQRESDNFICYGYLKE